MNLQQLIGSNPTIDPNRPVFVVIYKDNSHIMSYPNGQPYWTHNRIAAQNYVAIFEKDFNNRGYRVEPAQKAMALLCNFQAEQLEKWKPALREIKKEKTLRQKFRTYEKAVKAYGPHPLSEDGWLKIELGI